MNLHHTHIDILVNSVRSGDATGQHVIDLARLLIEQRADVRICSEATLGDLPDDVQRWVVHSPYANFHAPPATQPALTILEYGTWYPLAEQARQIKSPILFWYHGVTPPQLCSNPADQLVLRNAQQRRELVHHATLAVCTSPFTADELRQFTGYPTERTRIVPLGFDATTFSAVPAPPLLDELRQRLRLENKEVLLYVGRMAEHKRLDLLIEALAGLAPSHPHLVALLVGDTAANSSTRSYATQLTKQAQQLGVGDRLRFSGRVDSVAPYYYLANCYVQPSQHEGFCVPLLEAMAAGAPIVASTSGAMPWVLGVDYRTVDYRTVDESSGVTQAIEENDAAGLLFPTGDVPALTKQIEKILANTDVRNRLIENGRKQYQRFSLATFAENALAAVETALTLSPPLPPANDPLFEQSDVMLRNYQVRSTLPLIGGWIAWLRRNLTSHLKESYLDRILEQQVNYNRLLAAELGQLRQELAAVRAEVEKLRKRGEDDG